MFSGAMVAHAQHLAIINANAWFPWSSCWRVADCLRTNVSTRWLPECSLELKSLQAIVQHAVLLGLLLFLYFAYEACAGPDRAQLWPRWIWQLALIADDWSGACDGPAPADC